MNSLESCCRPNSTHRTSARYLSIIDGIISYASASLTWWKTEFSMLGWILKMKGAKFQWDGEKMETCYTSPRYDASSIIPTTPGSSFPIAKVHDKKSL